MMKIECPKCGFESTVLSDKVEQIKLLLTMAGGLRAGCWCEPGDTRQCLNCSIVIDVREEANRLSKEIF